MSKILGLEKSLTGIKGFDEVTNGGLPKHRLTLVSGDAGNGKTMFGMQFLINGAANFDEPGLFINFEVPESEIIQDFSSLNDNFATLINSKKIIIESIRINSSEFIETGMYNLEGLFTRIGYSIDKYKVKRIVLDTIEVIFGLLNNESIIRSELQRLFSWLKDKGVTAVVTAERGANVNSITRFGLEEYVADCVIILDHRIIDEISTRRVRIIKYRGSAHGENEYPFIIDKNGINVIPITSMTLDYEVKNKFISSGIPKLDEMLSGKGYYQGSSILISGTAGVGKSSFGACFADSICAANKKCIYFCFEESPSQIIRNMSSIGVYLERWEKKGNLKFFPIRPNQYGLEQHLINMISMVDIFQPDAVILDPISNFKLIGSSKHVKLMLMRFVDFLKSRQITTLFTSLLQKQYKDNTREGVSSLMDTWINLELIQMGRENNRFVSIIKSRGMKHSNLMYKVNITSEGIFLEDGLDNSKK